MIKQAQGLERPEKGIGPLYLGSGAEENLHGKMDFVQHFERMKKCFPG